MTLADQLANIAETLDRTTAAEVEAIAVEVSRLESRFCSCGQPMHPGLWHNHEDGEPSCFDCCVDPECNTPGSGQLGSYEQWASTGIDRGWCSIAYCATHDFGPKQRADYDAGGDACVPAVELNPPEAT